MHRKKYTIWLILVSTLVITVLHYTIRGTDTAVHGILRELYYIPVLVGAIAYGLRGAIISYLLVFVLYLPYVLTNWTGGFLSAANRFLPLLFQGAFACVAGYLVDRHRKYDEQLKKDRYLSGVGRVATVIVHDLKNPLVAIHGFAKRIQEGKKNPQSGMDSIIKCVEHMKKIVDSALDFAKPVQIHAENADLADIVQRTIESCRLKAEERNVLLVIEMSSLPAFARVDRDNMQRALVNLLSNAIESSEKQQRVLVSLRKNDDTIFIGITDSGHGMDAETLENIYTPFYTRKPGGTGVGMVIAKKIIEAHAGKIHIKSKQGKGTRVAIEIPAC